jgi:ketosteroid isomerase-like protein
LKTPLFIVAAMLAPGVAFSQQKEAEELLAADRAYAAAAMKTDLISGITAMLSPKVIMPVPPGKFVEGIHEATDALKSNAANATSKAEWTPIRAGISADGQHGFTFGYMTIHRGDGSTALAKYLSYWIKEGGAWKVAAYRRAGRPAGEVSLTPLPPSLPVKMVSPISDSSVLSSHATSLAAAEKSFSDEAAVIGLGPAFEKYGRPDAMNMGPAASFTFGNVEIGRGIGGPTSTQPSTLAWGSDYRVMVASSGDLGISIGYIRKKDDPDAPAQPFFTIWRRDSTTGPWRYIAE